MELKVSDRVEAMVSGGEISSEEANRFAEFLKTCNDQLMTHPVITNNEYCQWFATGAPNRESVTQFIIQFSVFSNLFLIAQLMKVINAGSLEGMRASKEILANEIGVIFNKPGSSLGEVSDTDRQGDPDIVSIEGTVDGGVFRFRAAHFEWLLKMGEVLDLGFNDLGKRRHGTPATLFFCDQLTAIYGNEDYNIAEGASFAVENWAAAGFWKQLVAGLEAFKKAEEPSLPLAFFTWHDKIEEQHAGHVMEELEEVYFTPEFDEEKFLKGGKEMLEGVQAFWTGLNQQRIASAFATA